MRAKVLVLCKHRHHFLVGIKSRHYWLLVGSQPRFMLERVLCVGRPDEMTVNAKIAIDQWRTMEWLNPPSHYAVDQDGTLSVETRDKTDFWQGTFYGFHRDDGHVLGCPLPSTFTLSVDFDGDYRKLYDQAGLIVRSSATSWIKCGVEYTDGAKHLSVVVTNGSSDWSAIPIEPDGPVSIRITRLRGAYFIQFRLTDGSQWRMARLATLNSDAGTPIGGIMACSPTRAGFKAQFSNFSLTPPLIDDIH